MIKLKKEIQGTGPPGQEKTPCKTIYDIWQYMDICNSKKVTIMEKKAPKNTIFYAHYFTFCYILYRQPQKVVIMNWKCFETMIKL